MRPPLLSNIVGETVGTFLLVFFGCGSVVAAVALGAQVGLFQVAIVWGFGVTVAILLTAQASGAHINPAITIAMASLRGFPWRNAPLYIASQCLGAFLAACLLYAIFGGAIERFEESEGIIRGQAGSEASAMMFGAYFPNPGGKPMDAASRLHISGVDAFLAELVGTALLAFAVFAVTDTRNKALAPRLAPYAIGATLTVLISLLAPISMGGFNPARDFAPRLFSSMAGWGALPFELNGNGWWLVYIAAPIVGGVLGGWLQQTLLSRSYQD